jgi:hypothetical protein
MRRLSPTAELASLGIAAAATVTLAACGGAPEAGWRAAEPCGGAITVLDAENDTRSWTVPAPPGRAVVPPAADLRRLSLGATAAGVCVRWTTAAPAPPGTTMEFIARGPFVRDSGGGGSASAYGIELELRENSARATFGLDRLGSHEPRELRVRVGHTGSVVSVFVPRSELDRPPANMRHRPPFPYRAFTFEARVLSPPDADDHRRVDFWPQERSGPAVYIEGRLCAAPCPDPRFNFATG